MATRKKKTTKNVTQEEVVEKVIGEIEEEIKVEAAEEEKPEECWPPKVGIWAGAGRTLAVKNLKLNPNQELLKGFVPKPGVILNGIGIMGRQLLPANMWRFIKSMISMRAANETRFRRGGKRATTDLGEFRG